MRGKINNIYRFLLNCAKILAMEFSTIASGSSGNCIYIKGGSTRLLVDVGCSMRHVRDSLASMSANIEDIDAILITHEHSDHISKVASLSKKYNIPVFASPLTWENLPFYHDYFPWQRHIFEYGMEIGDISLDFFKLSHDAVQPVGFVFMAEGQRVGVATDTGKITDAMLHKLANVDGLILEANHDRDMLMRGPYPGCLKRRVISDTGHLSNDQSAQALNQLIGPHTAHIILAHLSETNNEPGLALRCIERHLAASGIDSSLISVAPRKSAHELVVLDR